MKSICFLIQGTPHRVSGGVKVIFSYANLFITNGYEVYIIYAQKHWHTRGILSEVLNYLKYLFKKLFRIYKQNWFNLNKSINCKYVYEFTENSVPKCDYYFATNIESSFYLEKLFHDKNVKKFYLIQDFENWLVPDEVVYKSYSLGLVNITVSPWLYDIVSKYSKKTVMITNGFDFSYFNLTKSIESRKGTDICVLYHKDKRKRFCDSLAALFELKKEFPDITVYMFGSYRLSEKLPTWFHYVRNPNKEEHNRIYNQCGIFLNASEQEGWGLTVGEAMICGCAVVCAKNKGHCITAVDEETALLFTPRNINEIVKKVSMLINNPEMRFTLAKNGCKNIQEFSWDASNKKILSLLES